MVLVIIEYDCYAKRKKAQLCLNHVDFRGNRSIMPFYYPSDWGEDEFFLSS